MKTNNKKNVLLVIPSALLARGLESVFADLGEFTIIERLTDLSVKSYVRFRNTGADVIIVDPIVFEYGSRGNVKSVISQYTDAAVVGVRTLNMNDEAWKQYDEVLDLYDSPTDVINKLRTAVSSHSEYQKPDGEDLSAREKEILVCVAKGMLNKEIADYCHISIYTVITHRKNITRKTGIKTIAGLTVYALLNNLIDSNSIKYSNL